jgi:hypothetical protein
MSINEKLTLIQNELKAPKSQFNAFGKYHYRNQEDILEAVKPLLAKYEVNLTLSDAILLIGDRYYVQATANLIDKENSIVQITALAREEQEQKGMSSSQVTGSASSYARKYALNGLFLIDDTKDDDNKNNTVIKGELLAPKTPFRTIETSKQDNVGEAMCTKCGKAITVAESIFSKRQFGKLLCRNCQESEK